MTNLSPDAPYRPISLLEPRRIHSFGGEDCRSRRDRSGMLGAEAPQLEPFFGTDERSRHDFRPILTGRNRRSGEPINPKMVALRLLAIKTAPCSPGSSGAQKYFPIGVAWKDLLND